MGFVFKNFRCMDWVEIDSQIYGASIDYNGFFWADKTGNAKYINGISNHPLFSVAITGRARSAGDRIVFSPFNCKDIVIWNSKSNQFQFVPVDQGVKEPLFYENIVYENCVYFFGYSVPRVIRLNMVDNHIDVIEDFGDKYGLLDSVKSMRFYFGVGCVKKGGKYYFCCGTTPGVFEFNPDDESLSIIRIPSDARGYGSIGIFEDKFLLIPAEMNASWIECYDLKQKNLQRINVPVRGFWCEPVVHGEFVYLFPSVPESAVLCIDMNTYECNICEKLDRLLFKDQTRINRVVGMKSDEESVTFIREDDGAWVSYNFDKEETKTIVYSLDDKFLSSYRFIDEVYAKAMAQSGIVDEKDMNINEFLRRI